MSTQAAVPTDVADVDLELLVDLAEFERLAVARLPDPVRILVQGGAGEGAAIRANKAAWQRWALQSRVLVDVAERETSTTILGQEVALPVLIARPVCRGCCTPTPRSRPRGPAGGRGRSCA